MHTESLAFYVAVLRKYFVSFCSERMDALGVTYSQLFIMIFIHKKTECAPKEISKYLRLDAGQLNRTLNILIEKNLIKQRKNVNDRRANILCLTVNGEEVVRQSQRLFEDWDQQVLSQIDEESKRELLELMKKLVLNINQKKEEA